MQAAWAQSPSDSAAQVGDKLRGLAGDLTHWGRVHLGNVRQYIRQLQLQLQEMCDSRGRSGPSSAELKTVDNLVELSFHREEILWRQRSRIEWLVRVYKNTYLFHLRASYHSRKNQIKSLQRLDGQPTMETAEMEEMTSDF